MSYQYPSTPVITAVSQYNQVYPGSYTYDIGDPKLSQKYLCAPPTSTPTPATIFPGLFIGRDQTNANWINAQSLDQITTPTIHNIIGICAYQAFGELTPPGYAAPYGQMPLLVAGQQMTVLHEIAGFAWVWAGVAIDGTAPLGIASVSTTGGSAIYAGSLVLASTTSAIACAGVVSISPQGNGATYARGQLVPVSFSFYNR